MPIPNHGVTGCTFNRTENTPCNFIGPAAITDAAIQIANERPADYAKDSAPRSLNPDLSGNKMPMQTRLGWLAGRWKCNQFVGDAMYEAGYRMPTLRMPDGSLHYMNAERLPAQKSHFDLITDRKAVRPGDLLVIDYHRGSGEDGAHVEIVGASGAKPGDLITVGAGKDGASLRERSGILSSASASGTFWANDSARVYILRPKMLLH